MAHSWHIHGAAKARGARIERHRISSDVAIRAAQDSVGTSGVRAVPCRSGQSRVGRAAAVRRDSSICEIRRNAKSRDLAGQVVGVSGRTVANAVLVPTVTVRGRRESLTMAADHAATVQWRVGSAPSMSVRAVADVAALSSDRRRQRQPKRAGGNQVGAPLPC